MFEKEQRYIEREGEKNVRMSFTKGVVGWG
jgi:hypothetical protein